MKEEVAEVLCERRGSRGTIRKKRQNRYCAKEDAAEVWRIEDEEEAVSRGINGERSYKGGEEPQRRRGASKGERRYKEPVSGREVSKESQVYERNYCPAS